MGDRESQRALTSHVAAYTLAFVPALFWVGDERGAVAAIGLGAVIAASHLIQDDGRLFDRCMRSVKKLARARTSSWRCSPTRRRLRSRCSWRR